jgi:hypothetical protein
VAIIDVLHPSAINYAQFPVEIIKGIIKASIVLVVVCAELFIDAGRSEAIFYCIGILLFMAFPFWFSRFLFLRKHMIWSAVTFGIACFIYLGSSLLLSILWNDLKHL